MARDLYACVAIRFADQVVGVTSRVENNAPVVEGGLEKKIKTLVLGVKREGCLLRVGILLKKVFQVLYKFSVQLRGIVYTGDAVLA